MHVPRISERDDTLLRQIPQIFDRRAGAAAVARARANRREERARGVGEQALVVPFARDGLLMGIAAAVGPELIAVVAVLGIMGPRMGSTSCHEMRAKGPACLTGATSKQTNYRGSALYLRI